MQQLIGPLILDNMHNSDQPRQRLLPGSIYFPLALGYKSMCAKNPYRKSQFGAGDSMYYKFEATIFPESDSYR